MSDFPKYENLKDRHPELFNRTPKGCGKPRGRSKDGKTLTGGFSRSQRGRFNV